MERQNSKGERPTCYIIHQNTNTGMIFLTIKISHFLFLAVEDSLVLYTRQASLVRERLKSYPRVSEIYLSCTHRGVRFYISFLYFNLKYTKSSKWKRDWIGSEKAFNKSMYCTSVYEHHYKIFYIRIAISLLFQLFDYWAVHSF